MLHRTVFWLALLCAPLSALAQAPSLRASLDRTDIGANETVTLNIEADASIDIDSPDFSPLGRDFVVLGTQVSRSLSIENGQRRARAVLGIALRPRHPGHLVVPSLDIGGIRTAPLDLHVADAASSTTTPDNAPVAVEVKTDTTHAYVGQQIDYTVRLYYSVRLAEGTLNDPVADGADIRRSSPDATFQTQRGGRTFNVIERHYAVFPQRAGTLTIQPASLQGTAVDAEDPGAFFGTGTPVSATGQVQKIDVVAQPAAAGQGAWLPARDVSLKAGGWPEDGKGRTGQPITVILRVQATGLPFEVLPALSLPAIEGADVYPDKPNTGSSTSGPWITGWREQSFAIVPNRPGKLHIPETTLRWWNVQTDSAETATIPARDIEVTGVATAATAPPAAASSSAAVEASATPEAPAASAPSTPWRVLFMAAAALWVLTLVAAYFLWRRRGSSATARRFANPARDGGRKKDAFMAAAQRNDLAATEAALLGWARVYHPALRNIGALPSLLGDGAQRDAVAALQRARFGGGQVDGAALREAFARGFIWTAASTQDSSGPLPPLYPR
ncbi:hypothetical protein FHW69_000687 [Luteibacter sp. Sphag1AF]|uniref:BatD family protein n=1 Tax=Luteibacter sp. Sphag1AF TaxID=2587031 RepID=UPI00160B2CF7|nr:BatD family protein [Luteibacter sp. Sphag1AF]MBB3226097.1 hypothetical protein [Luteibacter sp. Sphag1AF]